MASVAEKLPDTRVLGKKPSFYLIDNRSPYAGYKKSKKLYFKISHKVPAYYPLKERIIGIVVNGAAKAIPNSALVKNKKATFRDQVAGTTIEINGEQEVQSGTASSPLGEPIAIVSSFWFAWFTSQHNTEF